MSILYFGSSQTPMNKQVMATDLTTTAVIWSPATGKKIALTDLSISGNNVVAGTIRIYAYPDSDITSTPTKLIFEHFFASSHIGHYVTPKVNELGGGALIASSKMAGNIFMDMGGFEF